MKKKSKVIRVPGELVDKVQHDIAVLRLRQSQEALQRLVDEHDRESWRENPPHPERSTKIRGVSVE